MLHKNLNEVELSEVNSLLLNIRAMQVDLEEIRKILVMRIAGKDTTRYDEEVKRYIKTIIGDVYGMGMEARAALDTELRRMDQAIAQARERLGKPDSS